MRPWSLGLLLAAAAIPGIAAPAMAQDDARGDAVLAEAEIADPEAEPAGMDESTAVPIVRAPDPVGPVLNVPAACRGGVVDASVERTGPSYGPAIPEDVKPKRQENPCLAPEFRPREESEVLYEAQRVFERDPQDDANRATPDPCVWREDGTRCSVSVNVSGGSAERNRRDPFQ